MAEQQTEIEFNFFERKHLKLRYHFDEYLELETRTGRAPTDLVGNIMKLSPSDLRLALWVGLKWQEAPGTRKVITLDWVGKQLQKHLAGGKSFMPILRVIDEAMTASGYFTPETDEAAAAEADPTTGAGGSSDSTPLRAVPAMDADRSPLRIPGTE